jgi:hypothetical protein
MRVISLLACLVLSGSVVATRTPVRGEGAGVVPEQNKTLALLDRYEGREREAVVRELAQSGNINEVVQDLQRLGGSWTQARGEAQAHHRRLVAATFALEVATPYFWPEQVDPLIEWACRLLRTDPTGDGAERLWFLTSLAVFTRARDDGRLVTRAGPGGALGQMLPPASRLADHVAHVAQYWPDEPRVRLAEGMLLAVSADTEPPRDRAWVPTDALSRDSSESLRRARAARAIEVFSALLNVPAVRAEASVRMGYLQLTLNDPEAALRSFAAAYDSDDVFVAYLARFLAGRALERLDRRDDAQVMYRIALTLVPHAQSASNALSANLFLAGKVDEAYAVAQDGLSEHAGPSDPWHEFGYGDRRFVPRLMSQLWEATK